MLFKSVVGSGSWQSIVIFIYNTRVCVRYPSTKSQPSTIMSKETTALSSTVDDISQGIGSVDISNNSGISAAVACDMSTSREEDTISENKCTSCDQKLEHRKTNDVEVDVSTTDMAVSICANCGKEGASNTCNKCKMVKYCNAVCKKVHKKKHKKDCEEHLRRNAELQDEENRRAAELHDIELFKKPPKPEDDCPICFLLLPKLITGWRYKACCGKTVCSGCIHAVQIRDEEKLCPFCRIPATKSDEENIKRLKKRVHAGDVKAIQHLGSYYSNGAYNLPQDHAKGLELYHRAADLGNATAYHNIGHLYYFGIGVRRDEKKAIHYYELGAMGGGVESRHNLGAMESNTGNMDRAIKHYMIAVRGGHHHSLKKIQQLYSNGHTTKDEYSQALQLYQKYLGEIRSTQRDEAAAAFEDYKYIE